MKKVMPLIAAVGLAVGMATSAHAVELVINGGFESNGGNGQLSYNTTATGWSVPNGGYTFLFGPGTADTTGANGQYGGLWLWGPGNGVNNGMPASSPDGGYFVAEDSAFQIQPVQQTINGLTPGDKYNLTFFWGGAQQEFFTGPTTDQFIVSLGSQTFSTPVINVPNHGFTGWDRQSFTYTATSSSEVLSFLANGTPQGVPPFALLDGVSMKATGAPEPGPLAALCAGGLILMALIVRRVRALKASA